MRGFLDPCETKQVSCEKPGRLSLTDRLTERETRLVAELEEIQKAKLILAKNPEFLELIDAVQRIGMY